MRAIDDELAKGPTRRWRSTPSRRRRRGVPLREDPRGGFETDTTRVAPGRRDSVGPARRPGPDTDSDSDSDADTDSDASDEGVTVTERRTDELDPATLIEYAHAVELVKMLVSFRDEVQSGLDPETV